MRCVGRGSKQQYIAAGLSTAGLLLGPERAASLPINSPCRDCKSDENWTCITFYPDLERFGMEGAGRVLACQLGGSADALRRVPPAKAWFYPSAPHGYML